MASLSETIASMRRLREGAGEQETMLIETESFGANPGALRMLSFAPESAGPGAPLVVVLHGCTQTAEAHARQAGWISLAAQHGFAVLAPEQRAANNLQRCFNWFEPARATREAASILSMIAHLIATAQLDARRVFVTGLSAGGAMTSRLLAQHPETFAAGAIIAGLPFGIADNAQAAWAAMSGRRAGSAGLADAVRSGGRLPRVAIWHGDADAMVHRANADDIVTQWLGAHGLSGNAPETQTVGRCERKIWRARGSGEAVVECNIVRGLGHGAPLSTLGEDAIGELGPHMLEAGVSSAREIARFWGIARAPHATVEAPLTETATREAQREATADAPPPDHPRARPLGERVIDAVKRHVPPDIEAIISKALKGAGLMK